MRLIDADKFEAFMYQNDNDDFDNGVQFVLEMIDKAPTVCDIDAIRAEIEDWAKDPCVMEHGCGNEVLQIIDKYQYAGMSKEEFEHFEKLAKYYNGEEVKCL